MAITTKSLDFLNFNTKALVASFDFTGMGHYPVYCVETKEWGIVKPSEDGVIWTNAIAGLTFNTETSVLTFTNLDGTTGTINIPEEQFLSGASYNDTTHILTYTMSSGDEITIDVSKLMNVYTVDDTASIDMTLDASGKITSNVKLSADAGNELTIKSDGLFMTGGAKIKVIS